MIDDNDVQMQLKKRARRRLLGAIAFFALAALVLPGIMDQEPVTPAQEVEIHIPNRGEGDFQIGRIPSESPVVPPETAPPAPPAATASTPPAAPPAPPPAAFVPPVRPPQTTALPQQPTAQPTAQPSARIVQEKPTAPTNAKPEARTAAPSNTDAEALRAAAILAGKSPDRPAQAATAPAPAPSATPHVIAIGTFSNETNVQNLKTQISGLGIRVYTEAINSPQGNQTRVRAGPFPSREAAEKALAKMQAAGISGIIATP